MLLLAAATVLALTGCAELAAFVAGEPQATDATDVGPSPGESLLPDATVTPSPPRTTQLERRFLVVPAPATLDVLIVVDNSMSMANVQQAFFEGRIVGSLANALRAPALGPDGSNKPCTSGDHSGCALPDLRVGVVSSDLGAPLGGLGNCSVGNGALLQSISRISSCLTPSAPWIAYNAAGLNVGGAQLDVVKALDEAIACIGTLGELGCGFEHTLEAMRRAIDPAFAINPGFLRPDATLAVILLTNEDDCSAADARLFDSSTNVLGPLTSHRCFANGFNCGDADLWSAGTKLGCRPAGPYLHEVRSRYVDFLQSLKPEGRLLLAAVAGAATARVEVVDSDLKATLAPACSGTITSAEPALRIRTLVDALAPAVLHGDHPAGGEAAAVEQG